MKKIFFAAVLCLMAVNATAQGIEFFKGKWSEALAKAKTENKLIFVDAYAEWCAPCKRMAATVFTQPSVGDFFNPNFINLKIDMEKEENAEFAGKYPVSAYPTLSFLDADGKMVLKDVGAKTAEALIEFGKRALGKTDNSKGLEERYAAGERNPEFLFSYVKSLNQVGKPSLKITNDYLATQTDLTTDFNLRFIHEGAVEADSRVFDLLIKNREKITALVGETAVTSKIETACRNTLKKALEFRSAELHREAKQKYAALLPDRADDFFWYADSKFYPAVKDAGNYLKAVKWRQKKAIGKNSALLHDLVLDMSKSFPADKNILKQAEKWAADVAENGGLPEYYLTWAEIVKKQGNLTKARTIAEKGKALAAGKNVSMQQKFDWFLLSLEENSH